MTTTSGTFFCVSKCASSAVVLTFFYSSLIEGLNTVLIVVSYISSLFKGQGDGEEEGGKMVSLCQEKICNITFNDCMNYNVFKKFSFCHLGSNF